MSKHTIGLLLIAVVALGAMTGVAAAEGDLGVAVDQDADGTSTVTVTENETAVENSTVNVSAADPANESYAGTGEYVTDANGTIDLPAPEEGVTVALTVEYENDSVTTTETLEAPAGLELDVSNADGEPVVTVTDGGEAAENAPVTVTTDDENATYAGEGSHGTDENGTVSLPAAEENVTVEVTTRYENESVSTTVDLGAEGGEADEDQPFGRLVQDFIDRLQDREGGIGAAVSDFVTENSPGNAPNHAGNASDGPGNAPDHAGQGGNGSEQGPPDHAGPNGDDAEEDDADESEDDDGEDDGNAGNGPGNGNAPGN